MPLTLMGSPRKVCQEVCLPAARVRITSLVLIWDFDHKKDNLGVSTHMNLQSLSDPATLVSRSQFCPLLPTLPSSTDQWRHPLLSANRYNVDSRSCNISKHVSLKPQTIRLFCLNIFGSFFFFFCSGAVLWQIVIILVLATHLAGRAEGECVQISPFQAK